MKKITLYAESAEQLAEQVEHLSMLGAFRQGVPRYGREQFEHGEDGFVTQDMVLRDTERVIERCGHGLSGLDWRVTDEGTVEVRTTGVAESDNDEPAEWQDYGDVLTVLDRVVDKAWEVTEITHEIEEGCFPKAMSEGTRLGQAGEAAGLRLDAVRWRALAPNAVMHFQFGPGVTVATDGTHVLVFSFAKWGTDCAVVHRNNIVGPITSTPVRTAEWDYVNNRAKSARKTAVKDEPAKVTKTRANVAMALAALLE